MTATIQQQPDRILRQAMRGNAIFSTLSGLLLTTASGAVAALLGVTPPAILFWMGVILVIFGLDLFWITSRERVAPPWGYLAVALDLLWVIGSALLLLGGFVDLTTTGMWAVVVVADIVALFAIWQAYGLWRQKQTSM